jgi:protein-S-isoprenylcysteine O-methyltransferase Ste14
MHMPNLIFYITLTAEALTTLAVIVSIVSPKRRIWPPARPQAWGRYFMLALFFACGAGVILLGILDWGSFVIPLWARLAAGLPLSLAGNGLALWAVIALGLAPTLGEQGAPVRRGPYRFSRNPQYVGFILALVGWGLLTNSALALAASLAGVVPLVLVPFAEEPWLRERMGEPYIAYMRSVARFIGKKK